MKFISAEEFLNQDEKIQKVFIDWWKPEKYDLFQYNQFGADIVLSYDESRKKEILSNDEGYCYSKQDVVPLLTEGQLVEFIEDKTNSKIDVCFYIGGYEINLYDISELNEYNQDAYILIHSFESCGNDLLKALWKVALEMAKENIENE